MRLLSLAIASALLAPAAAFAGPASDAVKFFYDSPTFEPDPSLPDRFVDPAKAKFEENDQSSSDGEVGCIDWGLAVDGQDFDQGEIDRTLKRKETVSGNNAEVVATFTLFPDGQDTSKREIVWTLKNADGDW